MTFIKNLCDINHQGDEVVINQGVFYCKTNIIKGEQEMERKIPLPGFYQDFFFSPNRTMR